MWPLPNRRSGLSNTYMHIYRGLYSVHMYLIFSRLLLAISFPPSCCSPVSTNAHTCINIPRSFIRPAELQLGSLSRKRELGQVCQGLPLGGTLRHSRIFGYTARASGAAAQVQSRRPTEDRPGAGQLGRQEQRYSHRSVLTQCGASRRWVQG